MNHVTLGLVFLLVLWFAINLGFAVLAIDRLAQPEAYTDTSYFYRDQQMKMGEPN